MRLTARGFTRACGHKKVGQYWPRFSVQPHMPNETKAYHIHWVVCCSGYCVAHDNSLKGDIYAISEGFCTLNLHQVLINKRCVGQSLGK